MTKLIIPILLLAFTLAALGQNASDDVRRKYPATPTPTPAPTPTPGIADEGYKGIVTSKQASVRLMPSTTSKVLYVLDRDAEFDVLDMADAKGWFPITSSRGGGFLHGDSFKFKGSADSDVEPDYGEPAEDTWQRLGSSGPPYSKMLYYREYSYRYGRGQAWVKWVFLSRPAAMAKHKTLRNVSYYLQYASVDCEDKRITLEKPIFYDKRGRQIPFAYGFALTTFGERVLPGSVGELIWYEFCKN